MKMCDECGLNPANVHLTQILQNETHASHLCEECARKKGVSISINETEQLTEIPAVPEIDTECAMCGLKLSEFKSKGWLGCGHCYSSFKDDVESLLVQVHGSSFHKGKRYAESSSSKSEIEQLQIELVAAIQNEEFEHAAILRDAIHSLMKMDGVE